MGLSPVSVIIPTFNRRHIVPEAIESALGQTMPPAEILVIDDGSSDDTRERLRAYGQRIVYRYQSNAGLSAARNHGMKIATQPFIALLDDDDVWHPMKLELQMRCLDADGGLGLLGTEQFDWPAPAFEQLSADLEPRVIPMSWERLAVRTLIPVSSVVFRRELVERIGDFDVRLKSSEDRDFCLRAAQVTRLGMIITPLVGYRDTPGSMCKNPVGREAAMREILRRLDDADAWKGRRWLRRKCYSSMLHVCAAANAQSGNHLGAVSRELASICYFPLRYGADYPRPPFERARRLSINLLRLLRLKRSHKEGIARMAGNRPAQIKSQTAGAVAAPQ